MAELVDQDARRRALTDLDSTLLVEAGAGTGKTSLLAGRLAMLLAAGVDPRGVVAITFTELAAGELRVRVHDFLRRLLAGEIPVSLEPALPDGLSPEQCEHLAAVGERLDELTCTTIHGFCYHLIRPYPVEARLDPGARVMNANEALLTHATLSEQWLREELEAKSAAGSPLAELIVRDPKGGVEQLSALGLFLRDHRGVHGVPGPDPATARTAFTTAVHDFAAWLQGTEANHGVLEEETAATLGALDRLATFFEEAGPAPLPYSALLSIAEPPRIEEMLASGYGLKKYRKKGKWQSAAKAAGLPKSEGERLNMEATELYEATRDFLAALLDATSAALLPPLVNEFGILETRYAELKRSAALLDFDDLLHHARDLLASQPDVRSALACRYTNILVDEFQDTDPLQAEILFRLCGESEDGVEWIGRTLRPGQLFVVGDPKQAIYRFRGADIATYVRVREALEAQAADPIVEIRANFRSTESVLDFVNAGFADSLSQPEQPGFTTLAPTVTSAAHTLPAAVALDVEAPAGSAAVAGLRRAEAQRVAEACAELLGRLPVRRDDGTIEPCRPGDIALLAPVGTELWLFEDELERAGIPIAPRAGKGLYRQQEVQDLIALVRLLADARDTLALGALLRGPLVGLTEEELLDITAVLPLDPSRPDRVPRLSLWTDPDDVPHPIASEVLASLQGLARNARGKTPFQTLQDAIEGLRVRAVLRLRHGQAADRALANVDAILELSRLYAVQGLETLAHDLMRSWNEASRDVEGAPDFEADAIQLLTIHGAKGLEWPVVMVINTLTRVQRPTGLLYRRADHTVHGRVAGEDPEAYRNLRGLEDAEATRERTRLWYVACTRARDLLVLPRHAEPPQASWISLSPFDMTPLPAFAAPDDEEVAEPVALASATTACEQDAATFAAEASQIAELATPIRWTQPSRHEQGDPEEQPREPTSDEFVQISTEVRGSTARGSVLHKLMEEVCTGELDDTESALKARASELVEQLGIEPAADPSEGPCPSEMASVVRRTLALPEIAEIRPRLSAEVPVLAITSEPGASDEALAGYADAVALDQDGCVDLVIDWKSDVAPDDRTRASYREQVARYVEALGAGRGAVVYLTSTQIDGVGDPSDRADTTT